MCSASPPRRDPPPKIEAPKIELAGDDDVRSRLQRRRRGRQQLRVDLNLPPNSSLQIGR